MRLCNARKMQKMRIRVKRKVGMEMRMKRKIKMGSYSSHSSMNGAVFCEFNLTVCLYKLT
jgi:hypothetical protein